jgi:glycosyltransferase involved in cell wall biosynthesis
MKLTWVAQLTKGNSYHRVSEDYIRLIRGLFPEVELSTIDISQDTPYSIFKEQILLHNPDVIIIIHNDSNIRDILPVINSMRSINSASPQGTPTSPSTNSQDYWNGKIAAFAPVDYQGSNNVIAKFDCQFYITMNEWAAQQIRMANPSIPVIVLEHIVEDFFQYGLSRRLEFKKEMFKQYTTLDYRKCFIVGMCNANNSRKRHDLAIAAFRLFNQQVPNSYLVIKTTVPEYGGMCQVHSEDDWRNMVSDLPARVILNNLPEPELIKLYNTFDLMINATDGEGFGLTPFEAALSGVLTILPYHTSFIALLPNSKTIPNYCVSATAIPNQYARCTLNYQLHSKGLNTICFFLAKCVNVVEIKDNRHAISPKEIQPLPSIEQAKVYTVTTKTTMENIIDHIKENKVTFFKIQVTSDIPTIQYYVKWHRANPPRTWLDAIPTQQGVWTSLSTTLKGIQEYIGEEKTVGIINPSEMCQKMLYYYNNPDKKQEDLAILQAHVRKHLSSEAIANQFRNCIKILGAS